MDAKPTRASAPRLAELGGHSLFITEHAPLPMATVEGDAHIVRYGNPAFCRLMDRTLDEIRGKPFADLLPDKDQCVTLLGRVLRTRAPESYTERDPSKPHPVFWSYIIWPVKAVDGLVGVMIQVTETAQVHETAVALNEALIVGSVRQHELVEAAEKANAQLLVEIGERAQAEEALRESEARFRAFVTASNDVVYRMSADWGVMRQLHGKDFLADTERPSRTWLREYIHPDDQGIVLAAIAEAIRTKSLFVLEHRVVRADGTFGWTFSKAVPLFDAQGDITEWFGAATDVTERKRSEAERRESEETRGLLAAIVESSSDAIIGQTLDGTITSWNAGAERLFGFHAAEIVGQSITTFIPPDRHQEEADMLERVRSGNRIEHFETVRRSKAGRLLEVSLSLSPIRDPAGTIVGASKIVRDITDQRQIAVDLERMRDEAMAAARAKDEFLAALSHELRTPLTPVLLLASDAAENRDLPDEIRADFDTIRKNISLEARLIDDLLDLTRISHGKLKLEPEPCDVHAVLHDVFSIIRNDLEEKCIRLNAVFSAERVRVVADPVRLQQIFWNVLRNAVHFTPRDGSITVATEVDPVTEELVIKITDTGIGITPEDLVRIFESFSQGETAGFGTSSRFGSLGLGLAISKTLVEMHAGSIGATSPGPGLGATFEVHLPLLAETASNPTFIDSRSPLADEAALKAAAAKHARSIDAAPPPSRGLMLIVEDHAPTRLTLQRLLERRHFTVTGARSVAEALAHAARAKFAFVISDIGLPDADGYALLQQLRTVLPDVRGIALSGYGTESDIARSLAAGFGDHLTKPVSIGTLDCALEKLAPR